MTEITELATARSTLADLLREETGRLVVLTGAGISTESGIPDFRSPGGIWSRMEPIQYGDFISDADQRAEDWRRRFEMKRIFDEASPNAAHKALAGLAQYGRLSFLITQNVDGLHQRSGVPEELLVELHGNSTYATCLECGARADLEPQKKIVASEETPLCLECGGLLKAAVVSFGQAMPAEAMEEAAHAARRSDLFLVVGSSLLVHPAAQLPVLAAHAGARLCILNREETPLDALADVVIRTPIAQTFEDLI